MTLKKYADAIIASKEENEKSLGPARAAEQKGRLGLEIATLKVAIQTAENDLAVLASKYPLDFAGILSAIDTLDLSNRKLTKLDELSSSLF